MKPCFRFTKIVIFLYKAMQDEYGNQIAGRLEDVIDGPYRDRRGGIPPGEGVDYGFIFLDDRKEVDEYFRLRRDGQKKSAEKYLNRCLRNSESRRLRRFTCPDTESSLTQSEERKSKDKLSAFLHSMVDAFIEDDRFGFITEEDIDRAISVLKELSNTRMTYRQAAEELGCSVSTLRTKISRAKIKTEHTVFLRRKDVEKLRCNAKS